MTPVSIVAAALFCLGLYGVLTRRDLVGVLACVEVMLGAASVQLVGLASIAGARSSAEGFALVLLVLAAAEASVGLALVIATVKRTGRGRVDELTEVSG